MRHITLRRAIEIVHEFFPKMTRKEAWGLLWDRTGWPGFWYRSPTQEIRASLRTLKRTLKAGGTPCEFCNKPSLKGDTVCRACNRALERARE